MTGIVEKLAPVRPMDRFQHAPGEIYLLWDCPDLSERTGLPSIKVELAPRLDIVRLLNVGDVGALSKGAVRTVEMSEASRRSRDQQQEKMRMFRIQKAQRTVVVPTLPAQVRAELRRAETRVRVRAAPPPHED